MYVCLCNAVTEDEILALLPFGLDYAIMVTEAGSCCGKCMDYIEEMTYTPVAQLE